MFGFIAAMVMLEEHGDHEVVCADDPGGCRTVFRSETGLLLSVHFAVFLDGKGNYGKCVDLDVTGCFCCGYLDLGVASCIQQEIVRRIVVFLADILGIYFPL